MRRKRFVPFMVVFSALALVAAACGGDGDDGGQTQPRGQRGGSAVAQLGEPETLDPGLAYTTTSSEVLQRVFEPPFRYDPQTAELVLRGAAESYEVSDDATRITLKLRQGATFHNGEPVNAQAFIRAWNRVAQKDTASEVAYHLAGIRGFDAAQAGESDELSGLRQGANEHELIIELDEPNAEFVVRLGHTVFSPIPQAALDDPKKFAEQPIGNGPYQMDGAWERNVQIKVRRFDNYKGELPGFLDSITWRIFAEVDQAYLEFQGGTLDATSVPPEQLASAQTEYGDAFNDQPSAVLNYLLTNTKLSPTDDKRFRQAMSMAIDRAAINQAVFNGQRVPATSIIPPVSTGHRENACKYCTLNVERAKQLMQEAGVEPGQRITITFNSGAGHEEWTAAVAAQLEENLGLRVRIEPGSTDFGDYIQSLDNLRGLGRLGWGQDYPTPDNWLYPLFHSKSTDNHSFYNSSEFDRVIEQSRSELDDARRLQLQQQAEDIVLEDMPVLPMFYGRAAYVYNADKFESFPIDIQLAFPAWEYVSVRA